MIFLCFMDQVAAFQGKSERKLYGGRRRRRLWWPVVMVAHKEPMHQEPQKAQSRAALMSAGLFFWED